MRRIAVLGLVLLAGVLALACGSVDDREGGLPDREVSAAAVRAEIASQRADRASLSEAPAGGTVEAAPAVSADPADRESSGASSSDAAPLGASSSDAAPPAVSSSDAAPLGASSSDAAPLGASSSDAVPLGASGLENSRDAAKAGGSDSGAALEQALGEDERQDAQAAADGAAEPERLVVVLDPGHGGTGSGAVGFGVIERDSNLDFALRVEQLLLEAGFDVILTRRGEARTAEALDLDPDEVPGFLINRRDLQARVDLANAAEADVFVSIHSNAAEDPRASGVEVYWDELRAHSSDNERLAQALQESVLESLAIATGFRAWDRGIREDTCWHFSERWGECSPLFILGPAQEIKRTQIVFFGLDPALLGFAPGQEVLRTRATQMPAALVELLFISNEFEAQVLKDETARQAMAIGIARGIERFFAEQAVVAEQGGTEQGDEAGSAAVVAGAG